VAWRRYRGGLASSISITGFPDLKTTTIPTVGSSDFDPVWVGNKLFFLSDRSGPVTLFRYDPAFGAVTEVVKNNSYDIRSISAGPGGIVYDQFGELFAYDTSNGKTKEDLHRDRRELRRGAPAHCRRQPRGS